MVWNLAWIHHVLVSLLGLPCEPSQYSILGPWSLAKVLCKAMSIEVPPVLEGLDERQPSHPLATARLATESCVEGIPGK